MLQNFKQKKLELAWPIEFLVAIFYDIFFCPRHAAELRESAEREEQKPVLPPGGEIRQIKITKSAATEEVEEKRTITTGNRNLESGILTCRKLKIC